MTKKVLAAGVILLALSGCSQKGMEPFRDAGVKSRNTGPAVVGTMPDGFSNWAFKCNGNDGVYVVFKGDKVYGSISVVPNDAQCVR